MLLKYFCPAVCVCVWGGRDQEKQKSSTSSFPNPLQCLLCLFQVIIVQASHSLQQLPYFADNEVVGNLYRHILDPSRLRYFAYIYLISLTKIYYSGEKWFYGKTSIRFLPSCGCSMIKFSKRVLRNFFFIFFYSRNELNAQILLSFCPQH